MAGWYQGFMPHIPEDEQQEERRFDVLKLILYDLNSAVAPKSNRLSALREALKELDHDDERKHSDELDLRADQILFQKLALAYSVDKTDEEVGLICTALEMVYRATRKSVASSFHEIGDSILPMFVEMIRCPPHLRRHRHFYHEEDEADRGEEGDDDEAMAKPNNLTMQHPTDGTVAAASTRAVGDILDEDTLLPPTVRSDDSLHFQLTGPGHHHHHQSTTDGGGLYGGAPPPPVENGVGNGGNIGQDHLHPQSKHSEEYAEAAAAEDHLHPQSKHYEEYAEAAAASGASEGTLRTGADHHHHHHHHQPNVEVESVASDSESRAFDQYSVWTDEPGGHLHDDFDDDVDVDPAYAKMSATAAHVAQQQQHMMKPHENGVGPRMHHVDEEGEEELGSYGGTSELQVDWNAPGDEHEHHGGNESAMEEMKEEVSSLNADHMSKFHQGDDPRDTAVRGAVADHMTASTMEKETSALGVSKVLKILRYFSRVLSAMVPMAHQPGLLDALLYRMEERDAPSRGASPNVSDMLDDNIPGDDVEDNPAEVLGSRIDAIATLVNLACAEENKITMVYHPGLLDAILYAANADPSSETREHAAIVIMNLAYADENKVYMANYDGLLDTLLKLLSDESPFTRRYSSAALFTLACAFANTARMARHCDGGILEALRKVLVSDPVDEARVNASEALFNMARNNTDDTVQQMGNQPKLLESLAHAVLTDYSADVRAYSARALEWLSADIHHPMPCHQTLLAALTTASQWTKTTCIAEALKTQASLSENRRPMVEHQGLLDALAHLALLDEISDEEVRSCAMSALERLTNEPSTRHIMVKNEGVMTALTRATFSKTDGETDEVEKDGSPTSLLMKNALKNLAEEL